MRQLIKELKQQDGLDIRLVGSASIINPLIEVNLIDDYHISIVPCLLGQGMTLFTNKPRSTALTIANHTVINDMIHTHYRLKYFVSDNVKKPPSTRRWFFRWFHLTATA